MKRVVFVALLASFLFGKCDHFQKVVKMDFVNVQKGELPFGWIVSCSGKSFPGIWEVDEKKRLFIKYPRGNRVDEKNIFFTKDEYFTNGVCQAKILSKKNAGILFRARDRKNYYAVSIDFENNKLIVEEVENKKPKLLLEKKLSLSSKPKVLKVAYCGDSATIFIDDKEIAKLTNLKKRAGGVGVVASGSSQAVFDDIVIKVAQ
ncbi:hypothetical protein NitYY0826_C0667 [Nitratiruptor sp. YY08-26]|uniref:hypothetical protein n=1 Tax=unclassified Nitratiruptor TaxID=2624044 RepID=UPI0019154629|nr:MULTISPECIES: hypothetical protein [unclassified Nitratiruptor]BCD61804.1 hypothetical protein NitYY0813_C0665 [Nitratiruptor sp. YY08-13]BCD65739.1 hypothetical protein NitYY0826_C0667 [Nitratiruptor sp. YY08-26]